MTVAGFIQLSHHWMICCVLSWWHAVVFPAPAHLHVVEIYVEGCEWLREGFIPPRQSAQPLCGVRLHGFIRLRAAAHRAAELPGCSHGQAAHLWHAKPGWKTKRCHGAASKEHLLLCVSLSQPIDRNSDGLRGLPVMPADLEALDSHTKHCGSGGDDSSCRRLLLEFILASL